MLLPEGKPHQFVGPSHPKGSVSDWLHVLRRARDDRLAACPKASCETLAAVPKVDHQPPVVRPSRRMALASTCTFPTTEVDVLVRVSSCASHSRRRLTAGSRRRAPTSPKESRLRPDAALRDHRVPPKWYDEPEGPIPDPKAWCSPQHRSPGAPTARRLSKSMVPPPSHRPKPLRRWRPPHTANRSQLCETHGESVSGFHVKDRF
jgi:hypothetical protein